MNKIITKLLSLFALVLASHSFYAAKLSNAPYPAVDKINSLHNLPTLQKKLVVDGYTRYYHAPKIVAFCISYFLYGSPLQYRNQSLPLDLSEQNLSGYDFTGCQFTCTNLTDTNLANAIFTNTTCDYKEAFLNNSKKHDNIIDSWHHNNLPRDLTSITSVYPKLKNNEHKAKLLHIACGFSRLPFHRSKEFYIKVAYWSCALLQLEQEIGSQLFVCSLAGDINHDVTICCWITRYPQNKVKLHAKAPHANFEDYLKDFTNGLKQYNCTSKASIGFGWYKEGIEKNIQGLQEAYSKVKEKDMQEEICHIADALSRSYQIQQMDFLHHYLFYQNRLIRLKNLVSIEAKNDVYYRVMQCRSHLGFD